MSHGSLLAKTGTSISREIQESFRAAFRGEMIYPSDAGYDNARKIWNASVDKHPGLIVRPTGVADVVAAVNFARDNDVLIAIRGGGHNVGGRALCDGGLVIDMSRMKGIHVDPLAKRVRVQAGATLGDLDHETHAFGLAVPTGVVSKTGLAGLTLGGGVGWLIRKYGMTCDNVVSFEIVTATGEILTASAKQNEDLFWALRGGGGNFGVVTSFEFQAHPVKIVFGGLVVHPRDHAHEVLKFYRDFVARQPEELTTYCAMIHTPDGHPAVALIACYCGDLADGERILKPLRDFGSPLMDAMQPLPFPVMQSLLDGAFPEGGHNYWKSAFVPTLSDDVIDIIVDRANRAESKLTGIVIEFYGGAASRVGVTETACPLRGEEFDIAILAQWQDPAEADRHIAWARNLADALTTHATGAHLLNFLDGDDVAIVNSAFGPNIDRLRTIKRKYDPANFFRVNQNISPAP